VPRQVFDFDPPERFVAGTVGQPGERVFFLQASAGGRVVSVALEKQQVAVLAERLTELLDEVRRRGVSADPVPPVALPGTEDVAPLDLPVEEEFRVGTMALAWETDSERVVVEAQALTDDATETVEALSDADEGPDVLRVRLTAASARAFVKRAERVVAAGRPPCPLCSLPLDPEGHVCPRQNGHRR
jgi:uncharacterized repeat protein (TIGR03847 family)